MDPLDDDGEVSQMRGNRTDRRQDRRGHHTNRRDSQRDLYERVPVLIPDDDAADVALVYDLPDFVHQLFAEDLELFQRDAKGIHKVKLSV